jgi:hypothetical protein
MSLQERVAELVAKHGSVRAAALVLGINYVYLFRLGSGKQSNPGAALLKKLGLRKVVSYERIGRKA